ncbi:GIY-YIG nuclease family protein [Streptomyces virginiae]|uniref:GIY-YIG nuclease family protein n=1 Tax=Streptomyces virginiae TaxID=1961 RepID=UPI00343EEB20
MKDATPERKSLHALYDFDEQEGIPAYLRELYPQFIRCWDYMGTGGSCRADAPGYYYVPAGDPDAFMDYELKVRRPVVRNEEPGTRTALYRLRNDRCRLLYVGISDAPLRRWPEHAKDKEWWPEVADFSLEWFESRGAALAAEAAAIRAEAPKYNVTHNSARR